MFRLKTRKKNLTILFVALGLYTILRFGILGVQPPGLIPRDYGIFHTASARLISNITFYQPDDWSPFKYSPSFLLIFRHTFHRLPMFHGWLAWCLLSVFLFAITTRMLWRWALPHPHLSSLQKWPFAILVMLAGTFGWHGYIEQFSYGQGDMIIFGLFLVSAFVSEKKPLISMLLFGLMLIMKPQSGILLMYFVLRGQWKVLAGIGLIALAMLFAPALGWGLKHQIELFTQWNHCLAAQDASFLTGNANQNLAASIARATGHIDWMPRLGYLFIAIAGVLTLGLWWRLPQLRREPSTKLKTFRNDLFLRSRILCFVIASYLILTPLSWRWITFMWIPIGVVLGADAWVGLSSATRTRILRSIIFLFALNGMLLQTFVAHALGIEEVDKLSAAGLYSLGNVLLLLGAWVSLKDAQQRHTLLIPSSQ